jgi:hypothetical protein
MKCIVNDGRDAVSINYNNKFCYEHYQIYDTLQKLYLEVVKSNGSLSWNNYLTRVLDPQFIVPWKSSLIDNNSGKTLDTVSSVVRAELE